MQALRLTAILCVLLIGAPALATEGERYLGIEVGYRSIIAGETTFHTPSLTLGGGYHFSDFALVEGMVFYGATSANDTFQSLAAANLAFRLLIDATQWIPSIGPEIGYLAGYSTDAGLSHSFYAGASACLEYRTWRTHSFALCGETAVIPFQDDFESFYGIGFRANGFLPYLFE